MADSDRLATELSALRRTLLVRPPGVEAVVRTVARRRRRRVIALMVTAIVAIIAISSAALGFASTPDEHDVTTSQSPTPSMSPSATPSGRASTPSSPSGTGTRTPNSAGGPQITGCRPYGLGGLWGRDNYLADVELSTY